MELADVLNDSPAPAPVAAPAPPEPAAAPTPTPAAAEAPAAPERGADGKFKAAEPAAAPVATPTLTPQPVRQELTPQERAFLARAQEETRKRQALEVRLAELEKKPAEPQKTFWEDPDAAIARQNEEMARMRQQVRDEIVSDRVLTSANAMRAQHPDFDEKVAHFAQLLQEVPGLDKQCLESPNPAEFIYKTVQRSIEFKELGNLDAVRAKMEAEIRLKLEAEFTKKQQEYEKKAAGLPPSLSSIPGASGNQSAPVWAGPTPLGDILAGKK